MTAIDGNAEEERNGFADSQDERHGEGRDAPCEPVDANDAQELRHRVRHEVHEHRRHDKCGIGKVRVREGDGRTGTRPDELGRDAVSGKVKEGKGEGVYVEHVFLPGWLCEWIGSGLCLEWLDIACKDVVLGETEEAGEKEGEGEDGDTLGVEGGGEVGVRGLGFGCGEGGEDDSDRDNKDGEDLMEGISRGCDGLRSGSGNGGRTVS